MPEGDTIFRAARTLNRALAGSVVTKFETQLAHLARADVDFPLAGRTISCVEATGKWMRICFSGDLILLTHMLMSGSWHIYRPGEPWKRARYRMRVAIYTAQFIAVAFDVPIAEFHTAATLQRHRSVQRLGPDVLAPEFDVLRAIDHLKSCPDMEVGVALLQQSLLAGIGNVFKSEICFTSRVNPFRKIATLVPREFDALVENARKLMSQNVTEASRDGITTRIGMRSTTGRSSPSERLYVYKRHGDPCRVCGTPILSRKQGSDARTTFWCPRCQA